MSQVINIDPEILGGTPVFMGTRVPIVSLFDYLEGGYSLSYFLEQFPSVEMSQVQSLLREAKQDVLAKTSKSA